ncbi:hypothetical protein AHiyo4_38300 [Arthrobacter sp. Hiyo4]|nr:hypothetical protein AHiyo4_38300 [Arthrobacter sp. Hiyo4]
MTWDMPKVIGHNARLRREELGLSANDFASQMEAILKKPWQRQTISALDNGGRAMIAGDVVALAHVLRTTPAALFTPPAEATDIQVGTLTLPRESTVFAGDSHSDDDESPAESALGSLRAVQRAHHELLKIAAEQRWLIYETQNKLMNLPSPRATGPEAKILADAGRWHYSTDLDDMFGTHDELDAPRIASKQAETQEEEDHG